MRGKIQVIENRVARRADAERVADAAVTVGELAEARKAMSLWLLQTQTRRAEEAAQRAIARGRRVAKRASEPAPSAPPSSRAPDTERTPDLWQLYWKLQQGSGVQSR